MAEKKRDYYEVLGVARSATKSEVTKAFLRLVGQYHPDVNSGQGYMPDFMIEINEAYEVLRNPRRRAVYDRYGHAGLSDGRGLQLRRIKSFQIINDLFSDFVVDAIEKDRLN
ncbi:MAG TPA: DnaJ domain-containing protein [Ktedonobacteraceae bacterium]|jgi:molecular chaperone DnaJ|nr:DnaJ domain-containing protein [Ktedonobacteraceae bacterium]